MFLCRAICSGLLVEMTNKVFPWNKAYCQMGVCAFCSLRDIPVIAQGGKVNAGGNLFEAALLMQTWAYSVWLLLKRVSCCFFLGGGSSSLSAKHRSTPAACHHNDDCINVVNKKLGEEKNSLIKTLRNWLSHFWESCPRLHSFYKLLFVKSRIILDTNFFLIFRK